MKLFKLLLIITVLCLGKESIAGGDVMLPTVSSEYFHVFDQMLQLQYGFMPSIKRPGVLNAFKELADKGDAIAALQYAAVIRYKKKQREIVKKSFPELVVLAKNNNSLACMWLAMVYRYGWGGIATDHQLAEQWQKKYIQLRKLAFEKDDPFAMWEELFLIELGQSEFPRQKIPELLDKLQKKGSVAAAELLKQYRKSVQ